MSEMVDRVARCLWDEMSKSLAETTGMPLPDWDDPKAVMLGKDRAYSHARAVIYETREPTSSMIEAGVEAHYRDGVREFVAGWHAAIDEALK